MIQKDFHLGVYGLIEKANNLLVVCKSRGPYKGLFDLPGGKPNYGESLLDALSRELKEELGIDAIDFKLFGNFSFLTSYEDLKNNQKELYHIALVYKIKKVDFTTFDSSIEKKDVKGSQWLPKRDINQNNSSPLLRKAIEVYKK